MAPASLRVAERIAGDCYEGIILEVMCEMSS